LHSPNLSQEKKTHMEFYHKTSCFSYVGSTLPPGNSLCLHAFLAFLGRI